MDGCEDLLDTVYADADDCFGNITACVARRLVKEEVIEREYAFSECAVYFCSSENGTSWQPVSELMCLFSVDIIWGLIHLAVGLLGVTFNVIALVVFTRLGRSKPYYVIAIFETITDLLTSIVAVYSGMFIVLGRPASFNTPICFIAGWLWNWNMVTTPMLLSLSGIFRIRAVYSPHNTSFTTTKPFAILICSLVFIYGGLFASFPFFFQTINYFYFEWWSICDFVYDETDRTQSLVYTLVLGPVPMICSLVVIVGTNITIARYLFLRYSKSWRKKNKDESESQTMSKQVVVSLMVMAAWYFLCYSLIIFHNFKNILLNVKQDSSINSLITQMAQVEQTYFYAGYNFCAFLNSFANPLIQLSSGNTFKSEVKKIRSTVATHIRTMAYHSEEGRLDFPRRNSRAPVSQAVSQVIHTSPI